MKQWAIACVLVCGGFLAGCRLVPHRNVYFEVRDAETLEPIAGAMVFSHDKFDETIILPMNSMFKGTDAAGRASQWVSIYDEVYTLSAPGYDPIFDYPEHLIVDDQAPVFYLFKSPRPVFRVVLPEEYVGPLFIEMNQVGRKGERLFTSSASADGHVRFDVPANMVVYDYAKMDLRLISAETGKPILTPIQRFLAESEDGTRRTVFVGSREEFSNWVKRTGFDFSWRKLDLEFEKSEGAGIREGNQEVP